MDATTTSTTRAPYTVTAGETMSTSGWHRCGKPCWWLRIGDEFQPIPRIAGRDTFSFVVGPEVPTGTRFDYGCGSGKDGVRRHHVVKG